MSFVWCIYLQVLLVLTDYNPTQLNDLQFNEIYMLHSYIYILSITAGSFFNFK